MAAPPMERAGYVIHDAFLEPEVCRATLAAVDRFRSTTELPEIHREAKGRALRYSVIDGHQVRERLPDIWDLYTGPVQDLMSEVAGEKMFPLGNVRAGVNVNIMPPAKSEYRWHYDRAPVTAVLYLNEVEGGETELYPGLRVLLSDQRRARAQRLLDRVVSSPPVRSMRATKVVVSPKAGRLVAMAGNRCWHSVGGVRGTHDRINIILAYDREGATFAAEEGLDSYLYTTDRTVQQDPNYLP
ncbi:MAG: hypothetical protein BMS9Abin07_0323 [Acidimicrobiia bacterium]|nr:MAG: hypothetical protein BMS9Abin07_0323 [Acidimicrobiia bacterium]